MFWEYLRWLYESCSSQQWIIVSIAWFDVLWICLLIHGCSTEWNRTQLNVEDSMMNISKVVYVMAENENYLMSVKHLWWIFWILFKIESVLGNDVLYFQCGEWHSLWIYYCRFWDFRSWILCKNGFVNLHQWFSWIWKWSIDGNKIILTNLMRQRGSPAEKRTENNENGAGENVQIKVRRSDW